MAARSLTTTFAFSTVAALALTCASFAQQNQDNSQQQQQNNNQAPANLYRAKEVLSSKVNINGNVAIGSVDDIVFSDDGYIDYLIVNNNNKLVTVPWEAAKFNFEKKTAIINISQEKFNQIPSYTVENYPVFTAPTYRAQTYRYYGMTPGQERRAIRRGAVVVQ